jgi:F5/8 type C domain
LGTGVGGEGGDVGSAGNAQAVANLPTAGAGAVSGRTSGGGTSGSAEASGNEGGAVSGGGVTSVAGAGTGGGPVDACSNMTWNASASVLCVQTYRDQECPGWANDPQDPAQAIDGDPNTRYASGGAQTGNEEFVVTFPALLTLSGISLTSALFGDVDDGPARYAVEYSTDGASFMSFDPPLVGSGSEALPIPSTDARGSNKLSIPFPATTMKAVKFKQTGTKGNWWSIREFTLDGCKAD